MNQPVEIRWANMQDCEDLSAVHVESYRTAYRGIIPDHFLQSVRGEERVMYYRNVLGAGVKRIAVLVANRQIVGYIEVGASDDGDLNDGFVEIFSIYILKDYAGRGFGKQLIGWALEQMIPLGYRHASLWVLEENKPAIRFYEKLAFEHDEADRTIQRGRDLIQLRYRKALA